MDLIHKVLTFSEKNQFDSTGPFFAKDEFCQSLFWGIMFTYVEGRAGISACICMQKFKFSNTFQIKHFHVSIKKKKSLKMIRPET